MINAFSLKIQRDNRKNALLVNPAKGKPEKKAVFSPHCRDKTTINNNKAFLFINRKLEQSRKIKTQPKNINQLLWQGAFSSPSLILKNASCTAAVLLSALCFRLLYRK